MKKIFSLFFLLLFAGCAMMPITRGEFDRRLDEISGSYSASPEAMEKIMETLQETGANKIRAFTGKTGGTSGKLDSIAIASLANDDLGLVFDVSNSTMHFYKFVSAATDAESDPDFIRPDDYGAGPGVWYLFNGFSLARSAIPQWNFKDSGATDYDDNARIYVDCTDTGTGTEDCDFTIAVQIAGNLTDVFTIDADGNVSISSNPLIALAGNYQHLTEIDSTDGDDAYTMTVADIGGVITNQGDDDVLIITLLEASTWYSSTNYLGCVTVMDVEGLVITVDPADGTDQILWDTCVAGDSIDSAGAVGNLITLCAVGANEIMVRGAIGVWVDGD